MSIYVLSILILRIIVKVSGKWEVKINESLSNSCYLFSLIFVFVLIDLALYYHVCKYFECKFKKILGLYSTNVSYHFCAQIVIISLKNIFLGKNINVYRK